MVRDDEINRLMRYAQGMGLSVRFKPYVARSKVEATWALDGTEIVIYVSNRTTKLDKVLSLIHELSHHKSFINDGRTLDPKVEEALDEEHKKSARKMILDYETEDTKYWEDIYNDTNCKFGLDKLYVQKDLDIWIYRFYYEKGRFPTRKQSLNKKRSLTEERKNYKYE